MKWETEDGQILELPEMGFGHLEASYRMVERRVAEIDAILGEVKAPVPNDVELTEESVNALYCLKSEKLKLQTVLGEFEKEIARRRVELEPGLKLFFSSPLWPKQ